MGGNLVGFFPKVTIAVIGAINWAPEAIGRAKMCKKGQSGEGWAAEKKGGKRCVAGERG